MEDWVLDNHSEIFIDEYYPEREILMEGKSKKKVSNSRKCRIKNSKGEYVDIKKSNRIKKTTPIYLNFLLQKEIKI